MRAVRRLVSEGALGWWLAVLIGLFAAFAVGVAILIGQLAPAPSQPQRSGPTGPTATAAPPIIIAPPGTPLPATVARKRTGANSTSGPTTARPIISPRTPAPRRRSPAKRKATRPHAKRKRAPQTSGPPARPPSSPPPVQPKPPVCITAPAPVTVTTPVAGVNAC